MANIKKKSTKKEKKEEENCYALSCYYYCDHGESQLNVLDISFNANELMEKAVVLCKEFIAEQYEDLKKEFKITVGEKKVTVSIPDEYNHIPSYDSDYREGLEILDYMIFKVHLVGEHTDEENMYKYFHIGSDLVAKERREEYIPSSSEEDSDNESENKE